ncbi:GBS Bsp-like repeat-containing protein [Streptococcus macacae]|nr:GBS Bsp-like repeat-containing protein [Streptococcus macacae]
MKRLKIMLLTTAFLGVITAFRYAAADTQATITHYDKQAGTFDLVLPQVSDGQIIKSVDLAVWSEENGQDDLKWYSAQQKENGQLTVHFSTEQHGNMAGSYLVHAYITYANGKRIGVNLGKRDFSLSEPQLSLGPNGIQIASKMKPAGSEQLLWAVWSDQKGQDDIKWYLADDDGKAIAHYADHKGYGTYHVHTYLKKDGKMIPIAAQKLELPKPHIKSQINKINDTSYEITVSDVPSYITSVSVPVWTEQNGQDDLQWYQASKTADGIFKAVVYLKSHRFGLGRYQVHFYGDSLLNLDLEGLGSANFEVPSIDHYEAPQVTIGPYDNHKGTFDINVAETNHSKVIKTVKAAVWSEANQENIHWYESQQISDGKAAIRADIQKHGNKTGTYHVHTYITYTDESSSGHVLADQQLNAIDLTPAPSVRITAYINERNTYPVGQCTWGVKELAPWIPNWLGNGGQWADNARAKGFRTGNEAKVGAVACWDDGGYGHVAYVSHVDGNHRIQVKEANYKNQQFISNFRGWFDPTASYWGRLTYIYPD